MSKRNTCAGTLRAETSTALPTVPVPKKKKTSSSRTPSFLGLPGLSGPPSLPGLSGFSGFPKNYKEIK